MLDRMGGKMTNEREVWAKLSPFGGPRPGELLNAEGLPDKTPEKAAFLDLVASADETRVADFRDRLESSSAPYQSIRNKLGTVLSLADRLGSCWWGCSEQG